MLKKRILECLLVASLLGMFEISARAQSPEFEIGDLRNPAHDYWREDLKDPFSKIKDDLEEGRMALDSSSEKAFVMSLLSALDIPASSQMLVFSTTSLQLSLISPRRPRALFFKDDLYLGYVPGGKIEIVSIDPELGGVFYIFNIPKGRDETIAVERSRRCMNCHSNEDTRDIPGLIVKSVIPGPSGGSLDAFRLGESGHRIPLEDRFGGWHVTGDDGVEKHHGNKIGRFSDGKLVTTNVNPGDRFNWDVFPVRTSDLLTQMIHEHQAGFVNRAVEAHYRARTYLAEGKGSLDVKQRESMQELADEIVRYTLFSGEAELPESGIVGDGQFKRDFLSKKVADKDGRSLRDFELKNHLFRYRCSYMIYQPVFLSLPDGFKKLIYQGMVQALDPNNSDPEYSHLSQAEKKAIGEILQQTHPDLREWPEITP